MNITEQKTTSINMQQQFLAQTDGANIYQVNGFAGFGGGNRTQVGVTMQAYNELKQMCQQYYDKLVEVGVIQKEKTPAELQAEQSQMMSEQSQMMAEMLSTMKALKQEVEVLKNERANSSKILESVAGENNGT